MDNYVRNDTIDTLFVDSQDQLRKEMALKLLIKKELGNVKLGQHEKAVQGGVNIIYSGDKLLSYLAGVVDHFNSNGDSEKAQKAKKIYERLTGAQLGNNFLDPVYSMMGTQTQTYH